MNLLRRAVGDRKLTYVGYSYGTAIGSTYAGALAKVAPKYPRTWFGILDDGSVNAPNVVGMLFNDRDSVMDVRDLPSRLAMSSWV